MTLDDVAALLKVLTAYDSRTTGEADLMVWGRQFADVEFADAVEAVHQHYGETSDWARPSDIRQRAQRILNARNRRPEVIAPGCFEPDPDVRRRLAGPTDGVLALPGKPGEDPDQADRLKRGIAAVAEALSPEADTARIHRLALKRARAEHGAPMRTEKRKTGRRGKPVAPVTDEVAAIARQYLADGHSPADVAERFGIAKWWCDQARREARRQRREWCGECAYETRQRWKNDQMVACPRCKPNEES